MRSTGVGPSRFGGGRTPTGAGVQKLRAAWDEEKLFAEERLAPVARLLELGGERATTGFNTANKDDPKYVTLRFRRPVQATAGPPNEGPTSFERALYASDVELPAASPLRIACSVRNTGGSSRGLALVVWGEALDHGSLTVASADIVVGSPPQTTRMRAQFEDRKSSAGKTLRIAPFPELTIPAGAQGASGPLSGVNPKTMVDAMLASQVHANIDGKGRSTGEGKLHIQFVPLTDPKGQCFHSVRAKVYPAARRPLRATEPGAGHLLRPLDGRDTLFVIVSMDLDQAAAAEAAAAMIERWGRVLDAKGDFSVFVHPSDERARPRTAKAKVKGFFASKQWAELREECGTERLVGGERLQKSVDLGAHRAKDGFTFGRSLFRIELPDDPEVPTLRLWMDVDAATPDRIHSVTALANSLMNEAMVNHRGIQALSGRWAWEPSASLDMTPYETACGVGGQCTLRRSWLSRLVRGATVGTLWLGGDLVRRIPDLARLEADAEVVRMGDGLRIVVANEDALDKVEAALAPLLPTREDWARDMDRLYGRSG